MRLTVHFGDGELMSYAVPLKPMKINKHYRAIYRAITAANLELDCRQQDLPNVEPIVYMYVFACSPEEAREAAVEKARDKWMRHRGWETDWVVVE